MAGNVSLLGRQLKELWALFGVRQKASVIMALVASVFGGIVWGVQLNVVVSNMLALTASHTETISKAQSEFTDFKLLQAEQTYLLRELISEVKSNKQYSSSTRKMLIDHNTQAERYKEKIDRMQKQIDKGLVP